MGETKYSPSSSKEWKNKVYFFNINYVKNLPLYDLNINKLKQCMFLTYSNLIKKNDVFNRIEIIY